MKVYSLTKSSITDVITLLLSPTTILGSVTLMATVCIEEPVKVGSSVLAGKIEALVGFP
jgi:hypothetical protein